MTAGPENTTTSGKGLSDQEERMKVPWYRKKVNLHLWPAARELLENYSKIPPEEVESHIYTIRDEAWNLFPYPCLGQFRFLELSISLSPHYPTILSRLKDNHETYLDLGCCFGQDIRKLVYDGVPSTQLYGCDLNTDFLDCGFDFFRDRETLKAKFFQADVFDPDSDLNQLDGKIDILYIGSFLHLFEYSKQVEACVRITELLRDKEGSMVLGKQEGDENAREFQSMTRPEVRPLRHNVESFEKMWEEVGRLTGTKWRVDAELLRKDRVEIPKDVVEAEDGRVVDGKGYWGSPYQLRFTVFRQASDELE